ncbi:class I SAM-dependent methyltransferase [Roseomonas terrae]|uniref:Class I SAM-dependent methyltransferase n=1 Tax=Neoroseomonas terrae TaxID=424799 RepID=A0ABS5ELI3_9PROT|nr:class I SAM-dependent methyltransferase [Neoroseomonas terrae]MBR0651888.1 class I SAM-dependent methyltransferase [Neoroseomonas terrae]
MADAPIVFNDGAAYEEFMGVWSRLAGEVFLDWLAPPPGLRWADIGCGNGASTEMLIDRCAPTMVEGIDPSPAQLAYARDRLAGRPARFRQGSAMELPFADAEFDAAIMALVLFFVPEPARGVAEMVRVVRPGGIVAAYAWDLAGGGFPVAAVHEEAKAMGVTVPLPPSAEASRRDVMPALWSAAGLREVDTRSITVTRRFADFDAYWAVSQRGPTTGAALASAPESQRNAIKERVRARLPLDADGGITASATANAVKGVKA